MMQSGFSLGLSLIAYTLLTGTSTLLYSLPCSFPALSAFLSCLQLGTDPRPRSQSAPSSTRRPTTLIVERRVLFTSDP